MLYFLISGFRISESTKSICFLCELIGSSVNQPPQPCCVDLNGRSINCESRFDTSIPARSIFWTWWLDQCIPEQVQHRNRNVLIFMEILVWTQKQCPSPVFPSISMDLLQGFRFGHIPQISSRSDSNAHQNPIPDLAWKLFLFKEPVSAEINMLEACWIRHRFPYRQTYEKLEEPNPVMSTREHLPFGNHLNHVSASRKEALTKKQTRSETGVKTKKGIKSGA